MISGYLGIDPGANGGIAYISPKWGVRSFKMPSTERDVWDVIRSFPPGTVAVIEKVGGYIKGGGFAAGSSAMFNFGMSYGGLRMALVAAGISFEEATPQKWQKALGIPSRKKTQSKTEWKNLLKSKAANLFPSEQVILATADSLLIALYCKRMRERSPLGRE